MVGQANEIEVVLRLQNLATKELRQFVKRTKGAGLAAEKSFKKVDKSTKKATLSLGKMAAAAVAVFAAFKAGQKVLRAGFGFLEAASDAEESFSKFSVVFGKEADRVEQAINGMAKAMGRSRFQLIEFSAGLQDTFVPLGFARREAADLSLAMVALATDVASFSNRVDADVIRDFTSALTGSSETVKKYGIIINEVKIQAEALNLGLVKTGEEMTDLAKTAARASLIFKGTSDAQGDALRTTKGWANQIKRLKAGIDVLRVEVGNFIKNELLVLVDELGGADNITRKLAIGFKFIGVATVGLVRIFAAVAEEALNFVDSMDAGGGSILVSFGKFLLGIEKNLRKLIASFPALRAEVVKTFFLFRLQLATTLVELQTFVNDVIKAFNSLPFTDEISPVNFAAGIIADTEKNIKLLEDAADASKKAFEDLVVEFARLDAKEATSIERLKEFGLSVDESGSKLGNLGEELGKILATKGGLNAFFDDMIERVRNAGNEVGVLRDQFGTFAVPLEGGGGKAPRDVDLFREDQAAAKAAIETARLAEETKALAEANAIAASSFLGSKAAVEQYAASLSDFALAQDLTAGVFQSLESGISQFSRDLVDGEASFKDFAQGVIKSIGAMIIQFLLLKAVRTALGIGELGNTTGGGLLGALGFEKGGIMPGKMGTPIPINTYAHGGVASSPQLAVFGEGRGNEAFVPLPDGKNIPVKLEGGGQPIQVTLQINAIDAKSGLEFIQSQAQEIGTLVANAVMSGSNGKLTKALGG